MTTNHTVSIDTLQGFMANSSEAQTFVATINGSEYEIGFGERLANDVKDIQVGGITYTVRVLFIWRKLGSDSLAKPFPAVAYSGSEHAFVILDEGFRQDMDWLPVVIEAVRLASPEEIDRGLYEFEDDDLMRLLAS